MIEIRHLNVVYKDRVLFDNTSIKIPRGKLSMIVGKSGSGKTTLFYLLGLISKHRDYEYIFDDELVDLNNQQYKSKLRKSEIAFIFQDKNLHEYMTIKENLKMYALISGKEYSDEKAKELLGKVRLDLPLDKLCNTLSGGEKQRLAIACALIKEASFIIADEPTSALDHDNRDIVIEILKDIAREGKMVLVASHDESLFKYADILYKIENHEIITEDQAEENNKVAKTITSMKKEFYKWYNRYDFGKTKVERIISIIIPTFILSICMILFGIQGGLEKQCKESLNELHVCEVFIRNKVDILEDRYEILSNIEGVKNAYKIQNETRKVNDMDIYVYPYYEYQLKGIEYEEVDKEGKVFVSKDLSYLVEVEIEGKEPMKVKGILKEEAGFIQGNKEISIYIPGEYYETEKFNSILFEIESFEEMGGLSGKISQLDRSYDILLSHSGYIAQIEYFNQFTTMIRQFTTVATTLSVGLLCVIYYFSFSNQKYAFASLKANGMTNREMMKLIMYNSMMTVKKIGIMIIGIIIITYVVTVKMGIEMNVLKSIGVGILIFMFIEVIPTVIGIIYMNRVDPEVIIR